MRAPPSRQAWEWAEAKRKLPKGSAEPGAFRSSRAPWVRFITERVADPRFNVVCAVMGSQMSKTDGVLLNIIGHKLDDDPEPILYIGPTQKNVESIAGSAQKNKGRVGQMIRGIPELYDGLAKGKEEKITEKYINGVRLGFGWAGSDTELASHPAAIGLLDEYDRMTPGREGDQLGLLQARTATYPGGTIVVVSTPLSGIVSTVDLDTGLTHWRPAEPDDIQSPTWSVWQEGTRHEWAWPCPECGEYFIPRSELLSYPDDASARQVLKLARLACPHCGAAIEEKSKEPMNSAGRAVSPGQSVTPDGEVIGPEIESSTCSIWVSGLCSPWVTFGQRAAAVVKARRSGRDDKLQVALNTGFGELHSYTGEALDWRAVYAHRGAYRLGEVPAEVQQIFGGGDAQKDRIYYVIRGWGAGGASWLLDYGVFYGATARPEVWELLAAAVKSRYGDIPLRRFGIDSGYNPGEEIGGEKQDVVYHFCRQNRTLCVPTKGQDRIPGRPFKSMPVDVNWRGRTIKRGVVLWHFDTDVYKSIVQTELEQEPGESRLGLPSNIEEDYARQLASEYRRVDDRGRATWIKTNKHNHYFDCEVIAHVIAATARADRLEEPQDKPAPRRQAAQENRSVTSVRRTNSDWLNNGDDWL